MSEEFEYIPWSQLASQQQAHRNRTIYIAAGVIAAIAIGALVARSSFGQASAQPQPLAQPSPTLAPAPPTSAAPTTVAPLYSEADLMALIEGEAVRAVAARAEWFVRDFFTADGDVNSAQDIAAAIGDDSLLTALPQPTWTTYVEWAETYEVIETMPGRFRALVIFRTIGGEPYQRLPVQAVELGVAIAGDGGTSIIELPTPVPLPGG